MDYTEIVFTISGANAELLPAVSDVVMAVGGECGLESFTAEGCIVRGYAQCQLFDEPLLRTLIADLPFDPGVSVSYTTAPVEQQDWNETWEAAGYEPVLIGDRVVIHDRMHLVEDFPIDIEINARQAFGTGTHQTTRMIVAALTDMADRHRRVLDCGCGTGILGIAALKLGAAEVVGYDIDQWSVENARQNAAINGEAEHFDVRLGDASILDTATMGRFDLVLANINRNILLADMPQWVEMMTDGATLVLSGFYCQDSAMLLDKASQLGLSLHEEQHDGDWTMLVMTK